MMKDPRWIVGTVIAFLGVVVAIVAAVLSYQSNSTQKQAPVLQHVSPEAPSFDTIDKTDTSTYSVGLYSIGQKPAEGVTWTLRLPGVKIDPKRVGVSKPLSMPSPKRTVDGEMVTLEVPEMNPGDTIGLQVSATGKNLPRKAEVSGRGHAVNSVEVVAPIYVGQTASPLLSTLSQILSYALMALLGPIIWFILELGNRFVKLAFAEETTIKIEIRDKTPERIILRTIRKGKEGDWITLLPFSHYQNSGLSFSDLEKMEVGSHTFQKR